jgi:hypothetical protein
MRLNDYIRGARHGQEAHDLELEAMRDPLLGDALDGFDAVSGDHSAALERLAEKVQGATAKGDATAEIDSAARQQAVRLRRRRIRSWSIAAAVLLVGVIGGVLLLRNEVTSGNTDDTIAAVTELNDNNLAKTTTEEIAPPVTVTVEEVMPESAPVPASAPVPPAISNVKLDRERANEPPEAVTNAVADKGIDVDELNSNLDNVTVVAYSQSNNVSIVGASSSVSVPDEPVKFDVDKPMNAKAQTEIPIITNRPRGVAIVGASFLPERFDADKPISAQEQTQEKTLDEVIVVGYGTQRKVSIVGASSSQEQFDVDEPMPAELQTQMPADSTTTAAFRQYIHEQTIVRSAVLGPVVLSFEVRANGRPRKIEIISAPTDFPEAAKMAVELLKKGPDWPTEPAKKIITINL